MKNLLVFAVTVALGYLAYDAMQPPPPSRPVTHVAAAAPRPASPKLYFHSALDAPAMSPLASTGTSYFSTDPNPGYHGSYNSGLSAGSTYWNSGSTYIVTPDAAASRVSSATSVSPLAAEAARVQDREQFTYRRRTAYPTPMPGGVTR